jgi:hypothetical protein
VATIGGFQVGPFEVNFQQNVFGFGILPNYVGLDWYLASYEIFLAGYVQQTPPVITPIGRRHVYAPGTVISQQPMAGALVSPGAVVRLTVAMENLLGINFQIPNPNG